MQPRYARPFVAAFLVALLPTLALAQDAGSDGGQVLLPDGGSAGEGGSDRDNPEGDDTTGRVVTVCEFTSDCSRGFVCAAGKCTWGGGIRNANGGCLCDFTGTALLFLFGVAVIGWRPGKRTSTGAAQSRKPAPPENECSG